MKRHLVLGLSLAFLAGCGGGNEDAGGLTADERQRLENIADRLDEENAEVRDLVEANLSEPQASAGDSSD